MATRLAVPRDRVGPRRAVCDRRILTRRSAFGRVTISSGVQERIELAGAGAVYPATSRAGDELAFVRRSSAGDIWKFEAGGTTGPVPFASLSSTLSDEAPQYSPKGDHIAFDSNRSGRGYQIYVAKADGTNVKAVTDPTARQGSPRWSPDGNQIAYDGIAAEDGRWHIYVVNADGGPSTRLTKGLGPENVPSWSRDGKCIYFSSHLTGVSEIYKVSSSGGDPQLVTDNKRQQRTGTATLSAWESSDGILYYTGGNVPDQKTLFAKTLPDGPERAILSSAVHNWSWVPTTNGLYYFALPDPAHPSVKELRFFDFAKQESEPLKQFESLGLQGLTVSPNGKTVLTSASSASSGDDLMLIQNYNPDTSEVPTNKWIEALAGAVMVVSVLLVWRFAQGKVEAQR